MADPTRDTIDTRGKPEEREAIRVEIALRAFLQAVKDLGCGALLDENRPCGVCPSCAADEALELLAKVVRRG